MTEFWILNLVDRKAGTKDENGLIPGTAKWVSTELQLRNDKVLQNLSEFANIVSLNLDSLAKEVSQALSDTTTIVDDIAGLENPTKIYRSTASASQHSTLSAESVLKNILAKSKQRLKELSSPSECSSKNTSGSGVGENKYDQGAIMQKKGSVRQWDTKLETTSLQRPQLGKKISHNRFTEKINSKVNDKVDTLLKPIINHDRPLTPFLANKGGYDYLRQLSESFQVEVARNEHKDDTNSDISVSRLKHFKSKPSLTMSHVSKFGPDEKFSNTKREFNLKEAAQSLDLKADVPNPVANTNPSANISPLKQDILVAARNEILDFKKVNDYTFSGKKLRLYAAAPVTKKDVLPTEITDKNPAVSESVQIPEPYKSSEHIAIGERFSATSTTLKLHEGKKYPKSPIARLSSTTRLSSTKPIKRKTGSLIPRLSRSSFNVIDALPRNNNNTLTNRKSHEDRISDIKSTNIRTSVSRMKTLRHIEEKSTSDVVNGLGLSKRASNLRSGLKRRSPTPQVTTQTKGVSKISKSRIDSLSKPKGKIITKAKSSVAAPKPVAASPKQKRFHNSQIKQGFRPSQIKSSKLDGKTILQGNYSIGEDQVLTSWAKPFNLRHLLEKQETVNPESIFGPIQPVVIDKIFPNLTNNI